jgi:MinD-like ATPase involved in chromosome partitioning or flagellar assembly
VLSAPRQSLLWREVTPDKLRVAIDLLARQFDIVLIDTAANLGDVSLAALREASMVLWLTSSDFSSINNSLLGLEALQQMQYPDSRIRLILNITSADDSVRASKIEEVLKRKFFWTVPYDKQIRIGSQIGTPAILSAPESSGSRAIASLAEAVTGGDSRGKQSEKPKRGWPFNRRNEQGESLPVTEGG